jgi:hypothetical protein
MPTLESISEQITNLHKTCDKSEAKLDKMDSDGTRVCIKNSERIRTMWWAIGLLASGGTGAGVVATFIGKGAGQ